ncbi:MAG: NAD(P)(+) transhydrogenase (Re/Si-specific) subunit beta [Candidatus Thermoplasmatota archaeon]|nr:NAD(P)(+) transhydrogenase (Re/Si-specific) subunit beta [Candidatus Thermoplasmatota archaeon]
MDFEPEIWDIGYLIASILFILGLKKLGHPRTAPTGNLYGASGMLVAVVVTVAQMNFGEGIEGTVLIPAGLIAGGIIGYTMAVRVQMTGMPEMVALFNGFGGAASALVAASEVFRMINDGTIPNDWLAFHVAWIAIGLSTLVGWMTLTGSLLAMMKLKGGVEIFGKWYRTPTWGPGWLNYVKGICLIGIVGLIYMSIEEPENQDYIIGIIALSCLLGLLFVLPIGGADMPVVVSLLNSLSGIRARPPSSSKQR